MDDEEQTKPPKGTIVREDGCVCPAPPKEVECEEKFETCPYDPRFPNTNQTKRCYFSFVDYQRCRRLLGDYQGCKYFLKCFKSLCPNEWVERWYREMENGTFPRKICPPRPIYYPDEDKSCTQEALDEPPPPCP